MLSSNFLRIKKYYVFVFYISILFPSILILSASVAQSFDFSEMARRKYKENKITNIPSKHERSFQT